MKIQFSDRAKQSIQGGQEKQEERSPLGNSREAFNALLQEVGARTRMEDGKPVLRFEPPLESENVEPERWAQAEELEGLFWKLCEERGY